MHLTIGQALLRAGQQLKKGINSGSPALDAEVLLSSVTGLDRAGLYRDWEKSLPKEMETHFFELVGRRRLGEPVAYLTGHREFMGLDFAVSPAVLIPRPETELLVETALKDSLPLPQLLMWARAAGPLPSVWPSSGQMQWFTPPTAHRKP